MNEKILRRCWEPQSATLDGGGVFGLSAHAGKRDELLELGKKMPVMKPRIVDRARDAHKTSTKKYVGAGALTCPAERSSASRKNRKRLALFRVTALLQYTPAPTTRTPSPFPPPGFEPQHVLGPRSLACCRSIGLESEMILSKATRARLPDASPVPLLARW
jgi:hypothetical protein